MYRVFAEQTFLFEWLKEVGFAAVFNVDGIHFFIEKPLLLKELVVVGSSGFR